MPQQEKIYLRGDHYYSELLQDIRNATESIDLESYIFSDDKVGNWFIEAFSEAANRGVTVRLLIDGVGLAWLSGSLLQHLEETNIQFRLFHPIPWFFWHWRYSMSDRPFLAKFLQLLLGLNHRNHRKVCIIDHRIAWVGSFNICHCHLPREQGGDNWRDTAVRLQYVDTLPLEQAFEHAWEQNPFKRHPQPIRNRSPFRLNYTRRRRRRVLKELLRRIGRSKRRIWITNAYFVPDERLLHRLNQAARQGIDVRIILPSKSDLFFMPWTSSVFYQNLLKHDVKIYEYLTEVLHAKTIIVDDWMTVGSSNLNTRSLLHDLEINVVVTKPDSNEILERQFFEDMRHSVEISPGYYPTRPLWQRLLAHLILFAEYWI